MTRAVFGIASDSVQRSYSCEDRTHRAIGEDARRCCGVEQVYRVVSCEPSIENPLRARQPPDDCHAAGFGRSKAKRYRNFPLRHRTPCGPWRSLRMTQLWSPVSCRRHHLEITSARGLVAPAVSRAGRRSLWICLTLLLLAIGAAAQAPDSEPSGAKPLADQEPITPIPPPPAAQAPESRASGREPVARPEPDNPDPAAARGRAAEAGTWRASVR